MKVSFFKSMSLLVVMVMLGSCVVGKKKFVAEENRRKSAEEQILELKDIIAMRDNTISELESIISGLERQIAHLETDTTRLGMDIRETQRILMSNMSQREQLDAMLRAQRETLAQMDAMLKNKIEELDERERIINDLRATIQAQNDMVSNLLGQVTSALTGFDSELLSVEMRDGKVYVAMSNELMFRSGSAEVEQRGRQPLALLAEVLKNHPEIDIFVEGHTDNVAIRPGGRFADNWDLSVIRATSIVRILTVDHNVNPMQIIASGRSEYFPVDDNSTADGRAKNRRTEIILAPRLDKLFQMLDEHQ